MLLTQVKPNLLTTRGAVGFCEMLFFARFCCGGLDGVKASLGCPQVSSLPAKLLATSGNCPLPSSRRNQWMSSVWMPSSNSNHLPMFQVGMLLPTALCRNCMELSTCLRSQQCLVQLPGSWAAVEGFGTLGADDGKTYLGTPYYTVIIRNPAHCNYILRCLPITGCRHLQKDLLCKTCVVIVFALGCQHRLEIINEISNNLVKDQRKGPETSHRHADMPQTEAFCLTCSPTNSWCTPASNWGRQTRKFK